MSLRFSLTFHLKTVEESVDWYLSDTDLSKVALDVRPEGFVGDYLNDDPTELVSLCDFSHRRPGFGPGDSQEESLLGARPESCLLALACAGLVASGRGGLGDREAVAIEGGCRRFDEKNGEKR